MNLRRLSSVLRNRFLPDPTVVYAFTRALFSTHKLPPGKLIRIEREEKEDRRCLLRQAAAVGPIFKATNWKRFCVCVVGLPLGRRLLRDHGANLQPQTVEMRSLFPHGFLRQMKGETHRRYRKTLVRGIRPENLAQFSAQLDRIAVRALADYAANQEHNRNAPKAYVSTLNAISSGMLIQIFFGAEPGTAAFERLMQGYRKLGPHEVVWTVGREQRTAFAEIRDFLLEQLARNSASPEGGLSPRGIAAEMHREGVLDATALGNLIYMVELGRFDVYSLFRWLTKYAAENPEHLERIAAEDAQPASSTRPFVDAFVQETLRMDQSERLIRKATRDIVFEGFLIPKFSMVRVCLWESHKSPDAFAEPFRFDPMRFMTRDPSSEQFSPFGLDHHHCPLSDVTVLMSTIFLRALARAYTLVPIQNEQPVRGTFHWQPADGFSVALSERQAVT